MPDTQKTPRKKNTVPIHSGEQSLAARIMQAQDDERRKISRELHDSVGQHLALVKMAVDRFRRTHSGEAAELEEAAHSLEAAITEIRTLSHLLHPPELELMGLRSALAWCAEGFQQRTGIPTEFEAPEEFPAFPQTAATALFRMVQESLTNIHRHAQASRVLLRVATTPDEFQIEIRDNGQGFGDLTNCRPGVGILGMQERLGELGGTLQVESGEGVGSSVVATIPLVKPEPAVAIPPQRHPRTGTARILIVDDHPAVREGVRAMLCPHSDLELCGEASNARQGIELAMKLRPDVILLDLTLGDASGWSVVRDLKAAQSTTRIIIFSQHDESYVWPAAQRAGCHGFLPKGCDSPQLVEAIRTVLDGRTYFRHRPLRASA